MDEEGDKKHDAMQNMASRPQSLQDYLADQLSFLDLEPDQLDLVRFLISHIDDNGQLHASRWRRSAQGYDHPPDRRANSRTPCPSFRSSTRPASVPATWKNACSCN